MELKIKHKSHSQDTIFSLKKSFFNILGLPFWSSYSLQSVCHFKVPFIYFRRFDRTKMYLYFYRDPWNLAYTKLVGAYGAHLATESDPILCRHSGDFTAE